VREGGGERWRGRRREGRRERERENILPIGFVSLEKSN
jgi:hypothetical protein